MFREYKDHKGIDVPTLSKILATTRRDKAPVIVFETPDLETSVAALELDLILAFKFLVDGLADHGIAMDSYLAKQLNDLDPSFKTSVMERFVDFRTANGIELEEDATFRKTKDISVYEIGNDLDSPW